MRQNTLKSVISGKSVTMGATPVCVGGNHSVPAPRISLVRDGNVVTAIEIRCGCGQVMVLDCIYDQPTESPASSAT